MRIHNKKDPIRSSLVAMLYKKKNNKKRLKLKHNSKQNCKRVINWVNIGINYANTGLKQFNPTISQIQPQIKKFRLFQQISLKINLSFGIEKTFFSNQLQTIKNLRKEITYFHPIQKRNIVADIGY